MRAGDVNPAEIEEASPERRRLFEDPTLGWGAVAAGGVEVHAVPGNHQTIIQPPNVEILAKVLESCIARAEGKTMTDTPTLAGVSD